MNEKIKIVLCDDHSFFREGVKNAFHTIEEIQIIGEAENGAVLLEKLEYLQPDMVIMGISMPVMDGVIAMPLLRKKYPSLKVIILTMHNDPGVICRMLELGANTYLTKSAGKEEIYEAIKGCQKNWLYINDPVKDAITKMTKSSRIENSDIYFTEKEMQLVKLLAQRKSKEEIATNLELDVRTIAAIIDKLKSKTGTKTQDELLMFAIKYEARSEN